MFWKESRVAELERKVKELSARLEKAEAEVTPFRVGDLPTWWWQCAYMQQDPRPTVTHRHAIQMLLDHAGVQFKKIDGVPASVVIEKKPKATA